MAMKHLAAYLGAAAVAVFLGGGAAQADVKVSPLFSDHMVLQQGIDAPVWGTADAGEEVTVTIGDAKASAKAGDDGKWTVKLSKLPVAESTSMTIKGKNEIKISDVAVGEVWIASGQSNMEFDIRGSNMKPEEKSEQNFPAVRVFTVQKSIKAEPTNELKGSWQVATPQTVDHFTAVGYYFGRELNSALKQPVGIIHTSWGGTPAEAWTDEASLKGKPDLAYMVDRAPKYAAEQYPAMKARYEQDLAKFNDEVAKAKAEGKPEPRNRPRPPSEPGKNPNDPTVLYNGMIAPLVPYGVKGAIWYQGESNAGRAYQYRELLPTMIEGWRKAFGRQFNFGIVSLANFQAVQDQPGESDWAELREAQTMTANMRGNGQALAIDVGDAKDIHPKDKATVGKRLAAWALADVYEKQDVVGSGPVFEAMTVDGSSARITFKHANGGLMTKGGDTVKGFAIAGEDKKWVWADAKIDGGAVVVSSPQVSKPVAVRYAWANNPVCNLYNKVGLPAVPFRTDDWPGITAGKK
jgi:sialate O-acetylesterase